MSCHGAESLRAVVCSNLGLSDFRVFSPYSAVASGDANQRRVEMRYSLVSIAAMLQLRFSGEDIYEDGQKEHALSGIDH